MEKLKILQVEITNYKRLGAFMVELDGGNLAVAGSTDQGKTTAISALWELLNVASDPIKRGEKKARIKILLGNGSENVVAERTVTASTSKISVHVEDLAGEKTRKITAKEFKTWFSGLAVNPHNIMKMKPTEQIKTLISAAHLPEGFDLDALDLEIKNAETARAETDTVRKRLQAKLKDAEPEQVKRVDPAELITKIQRGGELNLDRASIQADQENFPVHIRNQELAIENARAIIAETQKKLEAGRVWLQENPEVNTDALQAELDNLTVTNQKADKWDDWILDQDELAELDAEYNEKNDRVKKYREIRKNSLDAARWPLAGITIQDGEIHYNGLPLSQSGTSKQMLICGSIAAAAIHKSPLRIVRMDGVESMSQADFQAMAELFNKWGVQVLSSRVSRGGDIEDGELEIVDGEVKNG